MNNVISWCSNKENMKTLLVAALAIVFIIILKIRFSSGTGTEQTYIPDATLENETIQSLILPEPVRDRKADRLPHQTYPQKEPLQGEAPPSLSRDLFSPIKEPQAVKKAAKPSQSEIEKKLVETMNLKGTIMDGQGSLAIIDDETLVVGESIEGLVVTAIDNSKVVLSMDGRQYILRMK